MKLFDGIKRKRIDRIKSSIRKSTARYYIKKNSRDIKELQDIHRLNLREEKKKQSQYYEDRITLLLEKINLLESDVKWYREQWTQYCDLKDELEKVSGVIDVENLHNEVNRVFALLYSAKDKVEIIESRHKKRGLIGVK